MSENLYKDRIETMIQREIEDTERELRDIDKIVRMDIERLLFEHIKDIKEEDKKEFEDKYFESLKNQKMNSLQNSLKKFKDLKDQFLIECAGCQEWMNA